jgi:hypothetical protein
VEATTEHNVVVEETTFCAIELLLDPASCIYIVYV